MIDLNNCPICNSQANPYQLSEIDSYKVTCARCGIFEITDDALTMFQRSTVSNKIISISFWLRQHQVPSKKPVLVDLRTMRNLLSVSFISPKPKQQADYLILWMGVTLIKPNQETSIPLESLISIIGAFDVSGVVYIASFLLNKGLILNEEMSKSLVPKVFKSKLTFEGWERFYELQRSNKDSRLAFMAMKFSNDILNNIFNNVIKDAVSKTGFEIRKLDEEKRAGLIDDKLRVEIHRSKFLIADLSDDNNGAYWEAGFAEGLGIHVIYICEEQKFKEKKTHFDTNHHLTVLWKNDSNSLIEFAEELKATIRATFPLEAKLED